MRELTSVADIDAALERSATRTVVFFKHSPTCGTSAHAFEQIEDLLAGPAVDADLFLVDVVRQRPLSNAIAEKLNLRHESPQILVIRNGVVRWTATHYRVTTKAVADAIAAAN